MKNEKGFTLVELALAMLVVGIIVSLLASGLQSYLQKTRIDTTKQRMDVVEDALANFLDVNRRYPCPARVNVAPGGANFGIELTAPIPSTETECTGNSGLHGGGTFSTGTTDDDVRYGSVPVRTLNLSDEYMVDGWGNRFTYAVTTGQASDVIGATDGTEYEPDGGEIRMQDSAGNVFATDAHYALLSHGETGLGSFKLFSTTTTSPLACPAIGGTLDAENCDNANRNLAVTLLNSDAGTTFYDDLVRYQGQQKADHIPPGAIIPFVGGCPTIGWTRYDVAEGRVIMGSRNGTGTEPPANLPRYEYVDDGTAAEITAGGTTDPFDLAPDDTNGTGPDANLLPPYIALEFCQKT